MKRIFVYFALVMLSVSGVATSASATGTPQGEGAEAEFRLQLEEHIANVNPPGPETGTFAIGDTLKVTLDNIQYNRQHTQVLDSCQNNGSTCTLSRTVSVASTTSGGFGVSVGKVKLDLGLSYQNTYSRTASCTSPKLGYGQTFIMRPIGSFVNYTVTRRNMIGQITGVQKGAAFFPTGIRCSVR